MASPSVWREEFQQVEIESTAQSIGERRAAGKTGARSAPIVHRREVSQLAPLGRSRYENTRDDLSTEGSSSARISPSISEFFQRSRGKTIAMPQPPDFQYDVFLSHNHADKLRVRRLAERLKAAGVQMEAGLRLWLVSGSSRRGTSSR